MFKIPTSYFLNRMVKSENIFEWVDNYIGFLNQMRRRSNFFIEEYKRDWIKAFTCE